MSNLQELIYLQNKNTQTNKKLKLWKCNPWVICLLPIFNNRLMQILKPTNTFFFAPYGGYFLLRVHCTDEILNRSSSLKKSSLEYHYGIICILYFLTIGVNFSGNKILKGCQFLYIWDLHMKKKKLLMNCKILYLFLVTSFICIYSKSEHIFNLLMSYKIIWFPAYLEKEWRMYSPLFFLWCCWEG